MKIAIIGAGPSGLMASIQASKGNHDIHLFDSNDKIGKKLFITGKGRCNLTNSRPIDEFIDEYHHQKYFLYSALYTFNNLDLIEFFNSRRVPMSIEQGQRVFPKSQKSSDIIKALEREITTSNIKLRLKQTVHKVEHDSSKFILSTNDGSETFDVCVIATGGASYPVTGSNGLGYRLASSLGHPLVKIRAALCGLEMNDVNLSLQGLSLKNTALTLKFNNKVAYREIGELLFTHYGVSGPLILKASNYIDDIDETIYIELDLKPGMNIEKLDLKLIKLLNENTRKQVKSIIPSLLPVSLGYDVFKRIALDITKPCHSVTRIERQNILRIIKHYPLPIVNKRPLEEAIVTSGGVDALHVDPSTMESKLINHLYFCGEVLDFHGNTGGYNLQAAFSTGYIAGIHIANKE